MRPSAIDLEIVRSESTTAAILWATIPHLSSVLTPVDPNSRSRTRRQARRRQVRRRRLTALAILLAATGGLVAGIELAGGNHASTRAPEPVAAPVAAQRVPTGPKLAALP